MRIYRARLDENRNVSVPQHAMLPCIFVEMVPRKNGKSHLVADLFEAQDIADADRQFLKSCNIRWSAE